MHLVSVLNASKTQLLQYINLTRYKMPFYHSFQIKKHESMVAITRQYHLGAAKAVQISQSVYFDKGTLPELPKNLNSISDHLNN